MSNPKHSRQRDTLSKPFSFIIALLIIFSNCPLRLPQPQKLAFASDRVGNGDIFILDEWGNLTNVTASEAGDWDPTWSPDGTQLAFTSHQTGGANIWLASSDGKNPINLTDDTTWNYAPAWSPDGRYIAFISERDGDPEIFTQALTDKEPTQLTFNNHPDKAPNWSPTGDSLVFAAVVQGIEKIYKLNLADKQITSLLPPDLNGTNPVWRPDGTEIAFVGWENNLAVHLYTLDLTTARLHKWYTATTWLGSLSWSATGEWLFFTGREAKNHNVMALNLHSKQIFQLTNHLAWDDFPSLHPDSIFQPLLGQIFQANTPQISPFTKNNFEYGVNLADLSNAYLIQDIGFTGIKGYVNWATVEVEPGVYRWADPDNILHAAQDAEATLLLRVHGTPAWARPPDTSLSYPPDNLNDFAQFMTALVQRYKGQVKAYEIWNEPNLNYEWGYRDPAPDEYVALLKTAYQVIKQEDPQALVISAGLAPTGEGNPPTAWGDLAFMTEMYEAGAKGYFDAFGSHLYTYGQSPDFDDPNAITFNRVWQQHQVMLAYNDDKTPIWITEMGWNLETVWDLGEHHNYGISQRAQAQYLKRAYEKIEEEWPWVEAAYLFNLDFSLAPWYPAGEQMRWYAILNPDRTPRPAYTALRMYRNQTIED